MKKRFIYFLLVVAITIFSPMAAEAANWEVSGVNMKGVPQSTSKVQYVKVAHRAAGAGAVCNYNSHTNQYGSSGITYFECTNYYMTKPSIKNIGEAVLTPDVGRPVKDISVTYKVYAKSNSDNDVFWSKGYILKRN